MPKTNCIWIKPDGELVPCQYTGNNVTGTARAVPSNLLVAQMTGESFEKTVPGRVVLVPQLYLLETPHGDGLTKLHCFDRLKYEFQTQYDSKPKRVHKGFFVGMMFAELTEIDDFELDDVLTDLADTSVGQLQIWIPASQVRTKIAAGLCTKLAMPEFSNTNLANAGWTKSPVTHVRRMMRDNGWGDRPVFAIEGFDETFQVSWKDHV